jgi:dipeptidyl aminopeptidase/acylaminoacyl peptidase
LVAARRAPQPPSAPYGSWKSPVTSDLIVAQSIGLSEVRFDGGGIYWQELRPAEAGRHAVVGRPAGAAAAADLLAQPFNARTRVHEYGGAAWIVSGGTLYFSHDADQRLYRLDHGAGQPVPITPAGAWRFADGVIDPVRRLWIGVREDHTAAGREPVNTIVRVSLKSSKTGPGDIIVQGSDFYSSPRLSPDRRWLAYLAWDHPRMPWVGTTLYVVRLDAAGKPSGEPRKIAGGKTESIFQPEWAPDGSTLYFVSDRTGWWNLYRCDPAGEKIEAVLPMEAEFGQPQWLFGMSTYTFAGPRRLVCTYTSKGLGKLGVIELDTGRFTPLDLAYTDFSWVRAEGDRVACRAGSATKPASIILIDLPSGGVEVLRQSTRIADDPDLARYFTTVDAVEFPTDGKRKAFGLYYPAFNPDYAAPAGERPPLLVKCHGGPTGAASSSLDLRIQYWTSRGISVLDVNYGGSTGFGRKYRERLDENWGIVDVNDCVNGARFLAKKGLADGRRSVITGGSAGGYTVLAALTFHNYFRGGASHYGVSDLEALAKDTHKFESRYLDGLIGPYPRKKKLYRKRSPITYANRLSVPVIFFQGAEDAVVPPNQAEVMVQALRRKGTPVGYLLFSGEQHGFRKAENIKRSLDAELYFYAIHVFDCELTF